MTAWGRGVVIRHQRSCVGGERQQATYAGPCNCDPSYYAWVWDPARQRKRGSGRLGTLRAALEWRQRQLQPSGLVGDHITDNGPLGTITYALTGRLARTLLLVMATRLE